jgi:predicted DNA-binding WGR domain protein
VIAAKELTMRRFEMKKGSSNKFWEVSVDGRKLSVHFGRIGSTGQLQAKELPSATTAKAEHDRLVAEKLKKGYREV